MKAPYQKNTVKTTPLQSSPQQQHGRADRQSDSFADNRKQAHKQTAIQQMADASPRGDEIAQLQVMAEDERPNRTGLPDNLKAGIENLSGYSMDDVKVHYNSGKPATLQAHAYAQGTDIHLAPGQEKQLPHEAWHVVQQKQGRVRPTKQLKSGVDVNDDAGLEKEADVMGQKSITAGPQLKPMASVGVLQRVSVIQLFTPTDEHLNMHFRLYYGTLKTIGEYIGRDERGYYFNIREGGQVNIPYGEEDSIQPTWGERSLPSNSTGTRPYGMLEQLSSNWHSSQPFQEVEGPFGKFNVKHNRYAPYVTSNKEQYPDTDVRVDYDDMIRALKGEGLGDGEIAEILLTANSEGLTDLNAIRAAAMLTAAVYLAEEWRKKGAAKIFRGILRAISAGVMSLNDIPKYFRYVKSAQDGREQSARISAVLRGVQDESVLEEEDRGFIGYMSPGGPDMESDDEEREKKDSEFKNGRQWTDYG